ncbi:MAG: thiamine phosphate synthase [Verrucomicrobiae bacterium]|nr:thiamine phosphate synthase [Verrucomicrobiae bacterium]
MTQQPQPARFYPIVPDATWVARIAPLGIGTVQLRLKDASETDVRQQIASSLDACREHGVELIVNDYWQAAIALGANWLHLGQEDLATADLAAIRRAGIKLGLSTHDEAELETALAADPDYIALGPVYPTILKAMKWAPQGLDRIGQWKRRIGAIPLVAIGGLTVERAAGAFSAGADSLAVVTDFLAHRNPEARIAEWLAVTTGDSR